MEPRIVFDRIVTRLTAGAYYKGLREQFEFGRYEKAEVGELVKLSLPGDGQFTLGYVGEKPEKFEVVDGVLTVEMTRCILVFTFKTWDSVWGFPQVKMEVINAL